jgi:hypothetical protein
MHAVVCEEHHGVKGAGSSMRAAPSMLLETPLKAMPAALLLKVRSKADGTSAE